MKKLVQMSFLQDEEEVTRQKAEEKKRREQWLDAFQEWSDAEAQKAPRSYGSCGYMPFCDNCSDNVRGRPCARSLAEFCRKHNIKLDLSQQNFPELVDSLWKHYRG